MIEALKYKEFKRHDLILPVIAECCFHSLDKQTKTILAMKVEIERLNQKQKLKLLGVILLSDGYVQTKKGRLYLETLYDGSEELHDIFGYLCFSLFGKLPRKYVREDERFSFGKMGRKKHLISELYIGDNVKKLLVVYRNYCTPTSYAIMTS